MKDSRVIKLLFFALVLTVSFMLNAYAEGEDSTNTCTYAVQADLNKKAAKIEAAYEFVYEGDEVVGFDIALYNISSDLYVIYRDSLTESSTLISYGYTNNGTYKFRTDNLTDIVTYTFEVATSTYNCPDTIRKFTLVKPKRNEYHDDEMCEGLDDYFYCKEWITQELSVNKSEIRNKIQEKFKTTTTTTKCSQCDQMDAREAKIQKILKYKEYAIIVILVLIIIDIIFTIRSIINFRSSRI